MTHITTEDKWCIRDNNCCDRQDKWGTQDKCCDREDKCDRQEKWDREDTCYNRGQIMWQRGQMRQRGQMLWLRTNNIVTEREALTDNRRANSVLKSLVPAHLPFCTFLDAPLFFFSPHQWSPSYGTALPSAPLFSGKAEGSRLNNKLTLYTTFFWQSQREQTK